MTKMLKLMIISNVLSVVRESNILLHIIAD